MSLTAITGGIGAGKSVVSAMLTAMGYEVFDCDSEAKKIMDSDTTIKSRLKTEIHAETVRDDGSIALCSVLGQRTLDSLGSLNLG